MLTGDIEQKAKAWDAVCVALERAVPGFQTTMGHPRGADNAVAAIALLAAASKVDVGAIYEQCVEGLKADHDCPAVYALAAIAAEIKDAAPQEGAGSPAGPAQNGEPAAAAPLVTGDLAEQRQIHDGAAAWPFPRGRRP